MQIQSACAFDLLNENIIKIIINIFLVSSAHPSHNVKDVLLIDLNPQFHPSSNGNHIEQRGDTVSII